MTDSILVHSNGVVTIPRYHVVTSRRRRRRRRSDQERVAFILAWCVLSLHGASCILYTSYFILRTVILYTLYFRQVRLFLARRVLAPQLVAEARKDARRGERCWSRLEQHMQHLPAKGQGQLQHLRPGTIRSLTGSLFVLYTLYIRSLTGSLGRHGARASSMKC